MWGDVGRCGAPSVTSLRAEDADIEAGERCCAASSEHRVSTTEARTVNTAECGRVRRNACPLGRWLGDMNTYSASRAASLGHSVSSSTYSTSPPLRFSGSESKSCTTATARFSVTTPSDSSRVLARESARSRYSVCASYAYHTRSAEIGRGRPRSEALGPRLDESRSRAISGRISGSLGASRLQREPREGEGEGERRQQPQRGAAPLDVVGDGREDVARLCFAVGRLERAEAADQVREDRLPRLRRDTAEI